MKKVFICCVLLTVLCCFSSDKRNTSFNSGNKRFATCLGALTMRKEVNEGNPVPYVPHSCSEDSFRGVCAFFIGMFKEISRQPIFHY